MPHRTRLTEFFVRRVLSMLWLEYTRVAKWKSKTRVTGQELEVQTHELRVPIQELRVQIHELVD